MKYPGYGRTRLTLRPISRCTSPALSYQLSGLGWERGRGQKDGGHWGQKDSRVNCSNSVLTTELWFLNKTWGSGPRGSLLRKTDLLCEQGVPDLSFAFSVAPAPDSRAVITSREWVS